MKILSKKNEKILSELAEENAPDLCEKVVNLIVSTYSNPQSISTNLSASKRFLIEKGISEKKLKAIAIPTLTRENNIKLANKLQERRTIDIPIETFNKLANEPGKFFESMACWPNRLNERHLTMF